MKKSTLFLFAFFGMGLALQCQETFDNRSKVLIRYLDHWHNGETGIWETTSWWNAANILTALINNAKLTDNPGFKVAIDDIYNKTKAFKVEATEEKEAWICKNYINDFYDDEGWWALAWLDAWEYTGEQRYLDMANIIFGDITTGWSENGGLYWKKGLKFKSAISNGLTLTLATRLHLAGTKNVNGKSALDWATSIWEWMIASQLLNSDGNIQDGVRFKNGEESINENVWTYNQGVVLTGLVNLHRITKEGHYLQNAHALARATIKNMTDSRSILVEKRCEPDNCRADAKQFKGVFMRHLMYLHQQDPKNSYRRFIKKNAASIWHKSMLNGKTAPGVVWTEPSEPNGATVSSALDAFNAAISCNKIR